MSLSPAVTGEDRKWQAENDFRTLADAEEIRGNKARTSRAKSAGRKIVQEATKALRAKEKVARRGPRGKK